LVTRNSARNERGLQELLVVRVAARRQLRAFRLHHWRIDPARYAPPFADACDLRRGVELRAPRSYASTRSRIRRQISHPAMFAIDPLLG
jgi:hypothetical protein